MKKESEDFYPKSIMSLGFGQATIDKSASVSKDDDTFTLTKDASLIGGEGNVSTLWKLNLWEKESISPA